MASGSGDFASREERVNAIIAEYLQAVDAGRAPAREQLLRDHPDLAAELEAYFADLDGLGPLAELAPAAHPVSSDETCTLLPSTNDPGTEPPGTKIQYFGDYELLVEIARGGMGVVYKVRQASLNRVVALKMILAGQLASSEDVQRFRTEAEAAANLDHPNIVPIFEVGEHEGRHYFSMKLIDGIDFADWMHARRNGANPLSRSVLVSAVRVLAKVTRAVHHAHQRGILHRDLKPANVLVDARGEPHVTDFGLARRVEGDKGLTQSGAIVGTPSYMAPEQARSEKVLTTGVDVYGLGAILYEVLTGRPPFRADTPLETILRVLNSQPDSPRKRNPGVDRDLETICLKCLDKEASKRYGSAEALADELDRWLRGEPIQARPVGQAGPAWRWCRRNPVVAGLLGAVAASLVLGMGATTFFALRAEARKRDADDQKLQAETQRDRAEWLAYASRLGLAQRELQLDNVHHARQLLGDTRPELRGWEYGYVLDLVDQRQRILQHADGHVGSVSTVAFSPDGKRLVSAGWGRAKETLNVWDALTGRQLLTLPGDPKGASNVTFSADGKRVVTVGYDGLAKVHDATSGQELLSLPGHAGRAPSAAFSPDGRRMVSGGKDGMLTIRDATTGQQLLTLKGHSASVQCVAFSLDSKNFVSLGNGTIKVWDASTGKDTTMHSARFDIQAVAFSPDGKRIVGLSGFGDTVKLWDVNTGEQILESRPRVFLGGVPNIAFSPDGERIFTGTKDFPLTILDAKSLKVVAPTGGREIFAFLMRRAGHTESTAFSPDGLRVAVGRRDGVIEIWSATAEPKSRTIRGHAAAIVSVRFSPDGKRLVSTAGDTTLKIWDATAVKETFARNGHLGAAFSPDGNRIVSGTLDETLKKVAFKIWDAHTGQDLLTLQGQPDEAHWVMGDKARIRDTGFASASFSPDGTRILGGATLVTVSKMERIVGGTIETPAYQPALNVWDANTGEITLTTTPGTWISGHNSVPFSPDGKRFVTRGLKICDATTGQEVVTLDRRTGSTCAAFSPDGKRIASAFRAPHGGVGGAKLWDATTGRDTATLKGYAGALSTHTVTPHGALFSSFNEAIDVYTVAFSPDSKRLVSGDGEGMLRIYETTFGHELLTLQGHGSAVLCVAFSPDGSRIVAGCEDGTLTVWDATALEH